MVHRPAYLGLLACYNYMMLYWSSVSSSFSAVVSVAMALLVVVYTRMAWVLEEARRAAEEEARRAEERSRWRWEAAHGGRGSVVVEQDSVAYLLLAYMRICGCRVSSSLYPCVSSFCCGDP